MVERGTEWYPHLVVGVLVVGLLSACRLSEPLPDHLGLFAVQAGTLHELSLQELDYNTRTSLESSMGKFFNVFSRAVVLEAPPDYLIIYNQQLNPSDLHLTKKTPNWIRANFTASTEYIPLQIQPLDKPGMYRLRWQKPLDPGFYTISNAVSLPVEIQPYFSAFCAQCSFEQTRAALEKIKTDEAVRLNAATVPSQTLSKTPITFWYGPWPQSLSWTVTVTDTNISWTGFTAATIGYSEIRSVDIVNAQGPWGGILCLNLPPRITGCNNIVQISTVIKPEEQPKLREVARVAQAALTAWKQKYPNGLPYATAEVAK